MQTATMDLCHMWRFVVSGMDRDHLKHGGVDIDYCWNYIRNSVSLASLESKWQQKKQGISKGSKENLTAEEHELQRSQEQADSIRESRKSTDIASKLQAGGELSAKEIEYLKKNDPDALKEYEEVKREWASYKKQLKNCKSKEEVEKLKMTKMGHYIAEAKEITNDPYIPKAKKY